MAGTDKNYVKGILRLVVKRQDNICFVFVSQYICCTRKQDTENQYECNCLNNSL